MPFKGPKCHRCDNRSYRTIVVTARHCNYSAFNGYQFTPSRWSEVMCEKCGHFWRTKARYVDSLKDADPTRLANI